MRARWRAQPSGTRSPLAPRARAGAPGSCLLSWSHGCPAGLRGRRPLTPAAPCGPGRAGPAGRSEPGRERRPVGAAEHGREPRAPSVRRGGEGSRLYTQGSSPRAQRPWASPRRGKSCPARTPDPYHGRSCPGAQRAWLSTALAMCLHPPPRESGEQGGLPGSNGGQRWPPLASWFGAFGPEHPAELCAALNLPRG